jgi:regulatory protein
MKITKIEKKKRLYLVELDETERLYVTEDTIVRFFLSRGKDISEEELAEIRDFAQFSYGKNLALYHLSFKQRTVKEVRDYLTKHEIEAAIILQVIAALEADRWLDDARYARTFIDSNRHTGDKGPLVLQQKLMRKGIAKSTILDCLEEVDFGEMAERVAGKLLRKYEGKLPHKALLNKLTQSLMTKGFPYNLASSAIANLDIEKDEEEDYELVLAELEKQERKYARKYEGYELKQRLKQALMRKGYDFSLIDRAIRDYF